MLQPVHCASKSLLEKALRITNHLFTEPKSLFLNVSNYQPKCTAVQSWIKFYILRSIWNFENKAPIFYKQVFERFCLKSYHLLVLVIWLTTNKRHLPEWRGIHHYIWNFSVQSNSLLQELLDFDQASEISFFYMQICICTLTSFIFAFRTIYEINDFEVFPAAVLPINDVEPVSCDGFECDDHNIVSYCVQCACKMCDTHKKASKLINLFFS